MWVHVSYGMYNEEWKLSCVGHNGGKSSCQSCEDEVHKFEFEFEFEYVH